MRREPGVPTRQTLATIGETDRLRAILDNAAEGIITIDQRGVVQSFNRAAEEMFGYSANEVIGGNVSVLMPPVFRNEHDQYLSNYLATGQPKIIGIGREVVGQRKDGTTFPMRLAVSEVRGGDLLFAGFVHDLTEQKEAQARALQMERLAAIGQVSAGLAHESRNALQRSQACLEMLTREVRDRPGAMDLIHRIQLAQDYLVQLYEEVQEYASPLQVRRTRCDLSQLLADVWNDLEVARKDRVARLFSTSETVDPHCIVDPTQIGQVFRNLLENSLCACADPVEIDVRWSEESLQGRRALMLRFRNNGPPLTDVERERIFDAFFTTKTRGTGLGMTIAKRIVEAHGGQIMATANPAAGAEFVILLPR